MGNTSRFQFIKSQHVPSLTLLHAAIEDFSYDRHAYEKYASGMTLAGRQAFQPIRLSARQARPRGRGRDAGGPASATP